MSDYNPQMLSSAAKFTAEAIIKKSMTREYFDEHVVPTIRPAWLVEIVNQVVEGGDPDALVKEYMDKEK